ncbi:AraC family transcriptional regulator [Luteolibacter sp. LG18]|uniref:AraC family transcriptional regulator n=1 Tax=Luteolibacter sp. LG18 TaxID=2819286 RepID=UPI002B29FF50|nr:transcriptional regulator [Luteolibacter sp. LG18]
MNPFVSQQDFLAALAPGELLRLYDLMPDVSFFMKDTEGRFVALNRLGCQFCGVRSEQDAFGCTDRDFFPSRRAEEYMADDRAVIATGHPIVNRMEPAPEMEGSPHLVVTHKVPVRNRDGAVIGVAGFSRRVEEIRCASSVIRKLAEVVDRLHERFAETVSTAELAKQAGLSESQFERIFKKALGTSPRQYLQRIRIEHASRLLLETEETIASIAQRCGYYDHSHFCKTFAAQLGSAPSEYRKERQTSPVSGGLPESAGDAPAAGSRE